MAKKPSVAIPETDMNAVIAKLLVKGGRGLDLAQFQMEIGALINQWSEIERLLRSIFVTSISLDVLLSGNIFYVPEAFRDKIALVDVAVSHKLELITTGKNDRLKNPLWKEWRGVRLKALDLVDFRNRVAHGTIFKNTLVEGNYEIIRPLGSVKWIDEEVDKNRDPIDIKALIKWQSNFTTLYMRLLRFFRALEAIESIDKGIPPDLSKAKKPAGKSRKRSKSGGSSKRKS